MEYAFPHYEDGLCEIQRGMTHHDYLAAKAMQALIAKSDNLMFMKMDVAIIEFKTISMVAHHIATHMLEYKEKCWGN